MGLLDKLSRGICFSFEATAGRLTGAKRRRRNAIACFHKRINESDIKIYHLRNGYNSRADIVLSDRFGKLNQRSKKEIFMASLKKMLQDYVGAVNVAIKNRKEIKD